MYATATRYLGLKVPESSLSVLTGDDQYYKPVVENYLNMTWKSDLVQTSNPYVWGPAFWMSLHISAAYYPVNPSQIVRERMKQRILAIPYEVPCSSCRPHAISFIEPFREKVSEDMDRLDIVVSSRDNLVKFYVDFHNKVNARYGKRQWTYEEAIKTYSGQAQVNHLSYKN